MNFKQRLRSCASGLECIQGQDAQQLKALGQARQALLEAEATIEDLEAKVAELRRMLYRPKDGEQNPTTTYFSALFAPGREER